VRTEYPLPGGLGLVTLLLYAANTTGQAHVFEHAEHGAYKPTYIR